MVKRTARVMIAAFGMCLSGAGNAQCTNTPPTTDLGPCIDFMVSASVLLTSQADQLMADDWEFQWSNTGSFTDYDDKVMAIQQHDCFTGSYDDLKYRVSVVAHEMGHALRGIQQDTSTREAYIESWCDNEGAAVVNNILGRDEILSCSMNTTDIELAASQASIAPLLAIYAAGGNVIRNVGSEFCDTNETSTTNENYRDFFGGWYDKHY